MAGGRTRPPLEVLYQSPATDGVAVAGGRWRVGLEVWPTIVGLFAPAAARYSCSSESMQQAALMLRDVSGREGGADRRGLSGAAASIQMQLPEEPTPAVVPH